MPRFAVVVAHLFSLPVCYPHHRTFLAALQPCRNGNAAPLRAKSAAICGRRRSKHRPRKCGGL